MPRASVSGALLSGATVWPVVWAAAAPPSDRAAAKRTSFMSSILLGSGGPRLPAARSPKRRRNDFSPRLPGRARRPRPLAPHAALIGLDATVPHRSRAAQRRAGPVGRAGRRAVAARIGGGAGIVAGRRAGLAVRVGALLGDSARTAALGGIADGVAGLGGGGGGKRQRRGEENEFPGCFSW